MNNEKGEKIRIELRKMIDSFDLNEVDNLFKEVNNRLNSYKITPEISNSFALAVGSLDIIYSYSRGKITKEECLIDDLAIVNYSVSGVSSFFDLVD